MSRYVVSAAARVDLERIWDYTPSSPHRRRLRPEPLHQLGGLRRLRPRVRLSNRVAAVIRYAAATTTAPGMLTIGRRGLGLMRRTRCETVCRSENDSRTPRLKTMSESEPGFFGTTAPAFSTA